MNACLLASSCAAQTYMSSPRTSSQYRLRHPLFLAPRLYRAPRSVSAAASSTFQSSPEADTSSASSTRFCLRLNSFPTMLFFTGLGLRFCITPTWSSNAPHLSVSGGCRVAALSERPSPFWLAPSSGAALQSHQTFGRWSSSPLPARQW